MFQTVDEMRAEQLASAETVRACRPVETMAAVIEMLDAEIAAGATVSSRERTKTALIRLLAIKGAGLQTTELCLDWFDAQFPYDGWNPIGMPGLKQSTYRDYRKRARAAIARRTGAAQKRQALCTRGDDWTELIDFLKGVSLFRRSPCNLIPFRSTLPQRAREKGLRPCDLTNDVLRRLHDNAPNGDRKSLRNAARLIWTLQNDPASGDDIRAFFPSDLEPIRTGPRRVLDLPKHFQREIDEMVELASRIHFVRIKEVWEHWEPGTQENHRIILRRVASSLIATGGLSAADESMRPALENQNAIKAALKHLYDRAVTGDLAWSTAGVSATHLPAILERNGIDLPDLRAMIGEMKEFKSTFASSTMSEDTKAFCRALIERPDMLADFGTAHLPLRTEADRILARAQQERRALTQIERARVRQCGTVALFCAIETGGAPIRVSNFLDMLLSGPSPWLLRTAQGTFRIAIPAGRTKNKKPIDVSIRPDKIGCFETIEWFLKRIRPLFFQTASTTPKQAADAATRCPYLVPAVHTDDKCLTYRSFADWFERCMRDVAGIVCTPHNFRHGQASVLYFAFPERIDVIAQRLGDQIETVATYYAWVHTELKIREGQEMLVTLIRQSHQEVFQS